MNGLTSIVIDDESIGLKFGLEANQLFFNHMGTKVTNGGDPKVVDIKDAAALLHAGYVNYCTVKDTVPKHKIGYFIGFVEDNYVEREEELTEIAKVYQLSKHTTRAVDELKKDSGTGNEDGSDTDWEFIESFCYGELGIRCYRDYANLTLREFELMRRGWQRSQDQVRELNMEAWRQTRTVAYAAVSPYLKDKHTTVYDFLPLPGDPTAEQMQRIAEAQVKEDLKILDYWKQAGYLHDITAEA